MTWNRSNITTDSFFIAVYGNRWVVSSRTGNGLYYSDDGITWSRSNITTGSFEIPAYDNGKWIAGGESGAGL